MSPSPSDLSSPAGYEGWLARARADWNGRAAAWDQMAADRKPEFEATFARTAAALGVGPGTRALDAGCGTGQVAVGFAGLGAEVTAIDLAPAMLERARAHAAAAGVGIEFREGNLADRLAGDPAATYDVIHCRCVLQFSPDLAGVLGAFRRVLKPDGRLFAAVPGALSPIYGDSWRRFAEPSTNNYVQPWELEQLLEHLGWEIRDGWGNYAAAASRPDAFSEAAVAGLPRPLQQAAATFWAFIATPRAGG